MRKIEEKLKKNMIPLSISLVFISMIFNRFIVSRYGRDATIIIMLLALSISSLSILLALYKKKYLIALVSFFILFPFIVIVIGEYLHNDTVSTIGFVLIFIILPIITKLMNNYKKNK